MNKKRDEREQKKQSHLKNEIDFAAQNNMPLFPFFALACLGNFLVIKSNL